MILWLISGLKALFDTKKGLFGNWGTMTRKIVNSSLIHIHKESSELQSSWKYKISVDATIIPVGRTIFFGLYKRAPKDKWKKQRFPLPIPVSYIQYESGYTEAKSIYCGSDASTIWQNIIQAAKAYPYAEEEDADVFVNWPDSAYGIPIPGFAGLEFWTENNSNTFVREMAALIPGSPSPDIFPGKLHPGNMKAMPVSVPFSATPSKTPTGDPWKIQIEVAHNYIQNQFNDTFWSWLFSRNTDSHMKFIY